MSAAIIPFPAVRPVVRVVRENGEWVTVWDGVGSPHGGSRADALSEALAIAAEFGASIWVEADIRGERPGREGVA
jgi:hypothetical protein